MKDSGLPIMTVTVKNNNGSSSSTSPPSSSASSQSASSPWAGCLIRVGIFSVVTGLCGIMMMMDRESASILSFGNTPFGRGGGAATSEFDLVTAHRTGDVRPGRFPRFGSADFSRQCNWTTMGREPWGNCTVLSTPRPSGHEGIAQWLSETAMRYIVARQAGCRLLIDYGPDVDIRQVLENAHSGEDEEDEDNAIANDWIIPPNFECTRETNCILEYFLPNIPPDGIFNSGIPGLSAKQLAPIPRYRFAYHHQTGWLYDQQYAELARTLDGNFRVDTGMACALGDLFHLSPTASDYVPQLFTTILPTLQNNVVFALYVRTGLAERKNVTEPWGDIVLREDQMVKATVDKALRLEQKYITGALGGGGGKEPLARIVWMVVTDDPHVREAITRKYDGGDVRRASAGGASNRRRLLRTRTLKQKQKTVHTGSVFGDGTTIVNITTTAPNSSLQQVQSKQIPGGGGHVQKHEARTRPKPQPLAGRPQPKVILGGVGGGGNGNGKTGATDTQIKPRAPPITRQVLVTGTRGAHTRLQEGVSTADFAEAIIDWYLIGESDLVIASKAYSFGMTASMRTVRPVYDPMNTEDKAEVFVHKGKPFDMKDQFAGILDQLCAKRTNFRGKISVQGRSYDLDCKGAKHRRRLAMTFIMDHDLMEEFVDFFAPLLEGDGSMIESIDFIPY